MQNVLVPRKIAKMQIKILQKSRLPKDTYLFQFLFSFGVILDTKLIPYLSFRLVFLPSLSDYTYQTHI